MKGKSTKFKTAKGKQKKLTQATKKKRSRAEEKEHKSKQAALRHKIAGRKWLAIVGESGRQAETRIEE